MFTWFLITLIVAFTAAFLSALICGKVRKAREDAATASRLETWAENHGDCFLPPDSRRS